MEVTTKKVKLGKETEGKEILSSERSQTPTPVVFCHIPKCGGSSLRESMHSMLPR